MKQEREREQSHGFFRAKKKTRLRAACPRTRLSVFACRFIFDTSRVARRYHCHGTALQCKRCINHGGECSLYATSLEQPGHGPTPVGIGDMGVFIYI